MVLRSVQCEVKSLMIRAFIEDFENSVCTSVANQQFHSKWLLEIFRVNSGVVGLPLIVRDGSCTLTPATCD